MNKMQKQAWKVKWKGKGSGRERGVHVAWVKFYISKQPLLLEFSYCLCLIPFPSLIIADLLNDFEEMLLVIAIAMPAMNFALFSR
jgi:hypothetical protein